MTEARLADIAAAYLDTMRAITDADTSDERIALRNALIAHPTLSRLYVSPMQ